MASVGVICSQWTYPANAARNLSTNCGKEAPYSTVRYTSHCTFPRFRTASRNNISCAKDSRSQIGIDCATGNVFNDGKIATLELFSPCKINIFLRITGKKEDGFHDLASMFHVISLGDVISFSLSPLKNEDVLSANVPGLPLDDRNLIIKALNLYRRKTGSENFFKIHVVKKVPSGAGLGGGSSNAATALYAANQFSKNLASEKEMQKWSSEIGSDVPFFFSHGAAYCTGRGEVVDDIFPPLSSTIPMLLIKPREACPTAEVYRRLRLDQTCKENPLALLEKLRTNGITQDVCVNDLEPAAFEFLPALKILKERIVAEGSNYDAVFMSGSGSTIVAIGSSKPPQFVHHELRDAFVSKARFIGRVPNSWYM